MTGCWAGRVDCVGWHGGRADTWVGDAGEEGACWLCAEGGGEAVG